MHSPVDYVMEVTETSFSESGVPRRLSRETSNFRQLGCPALQWGRGGVRSTNGGGSKIYQCLGMSRLKNCFTSFNPVFTKLEIKLIPAFRALCDKKFVRELCLVPRWN